VNGLRRLAPPSAGAAAHPAGRFPAAFGRRFFLLLLLGLIWIGPAWSAPRFLYGMAVWDAMALAAWLWEFRRLPRPGELEVTRRWGGVAALAAPVEITIELRNRARVPIFAVVTDDAPEGLRDEPAPLEMHAPAGGVGRASYSVVPRRRGVARMGRVWLRYGGRFGLAERWAVAPVEQDVCIYPDLEQARHNALFLFRSRQPQAERRRERRRGRGHEFESLRDYLSGDDYRDICWTATARRGKPISKVYQAERSQTVWLLLDAGRLLRARVAALSKLDFAVNAALGLAQVALYSGDRVGLLSYGRKVQCRLAPANKPGQLRALADALALVASEPLEADHYRATETLLRLEKRRSLVIWLTDLAETATTPEVVECAAALTGRHLVLFVVVGQRELAELAAARPAASREMYRYAAAQEVIQQRELLLRRLRVHGALAVEFQPAELALAVINRYMEIKERSLL
jgi:uncharacterized protein (DUF58 family)